MVIWTAKITAGKAKGAEAIQLVREEEEIEREEITLLMQAQKDFAEALKVDTDDMGTQYSRMIDATIFTGASEVIREVSKKDFLKRLSKISANMRNLLAFHKNINKIANDICDAITEARKDVPEGYSKYSPDEYRVLNQMLDAKGFIVNLTAKIDDLIATLHQFRDSSNDRRSFYNQKQAIFEGFAHLITTLKELYTLQEEVYKLFELLYTAKK